MMALITCETIFWALFCGFQYLSIFGLGILVFDLDRPNGKLTILLILSAYIFHSGYYVTIDSSFFAPMLKILMMLLYIYFIMLSCFLLKKNLVIISTNIDYIFEQDMASSDDSSI